MTAHTIRTTAVLSALAAGLALAIAWMTQTWIGLAPCELCLWERWPYRVVVLLALIAAVLPRGLARALLWLVVLTLLADVALSVIHVGVEQHYWPSPLPECAAPTFSGGSIADMLKSMPSQPSKPCDSPSFLIPGVPISMAGMDLIFSVVFALALIVTLWRDRRSGS
jgi:disulfide bond formation protein DsbB